MTTVPRVAYLNQCPHCRLALSTRAALVLPRHCPRCLARRRRRVELRPVADAAASARTARIAPASVSGS
jgi:hypothetical protein